MSNLIEIIPGLYLGTYSGSNVIGNIISINKPLTGELKILNLDIDPNLLYLKTELDNKKIIDYETVNNFILESYKSGINTIIYCDNIIISMLICVQFITNYLDMSILETIYIISKKTQVNTENLPKNIIYDLFKYYQINKIK